MQAHEEAIQHSQSSLHKMPEYFLAMRVADYFATHFTSFGYRLEAQVKRTFESADLWHHEINTLLDEPEMRSNGRFDLVLIKKGHGRAAHVLEFKRGPKRASLLKDVRRLAKLCEHAGTHRLGTNYLIFTRRCNSGGHGAPLSDDAFLQELTAFDRVTCKIRSSEPMQPLLDGNYEVIEGRAFQVVVVEITTVD